MKKITAFIFLMIFALCGCSDTTEAPQTSSSDEIRAVWIFYSEISMINENGGTEKSFTEKIGKMLDDCKSINVNNVFVQVRPFADSFYPSKVFPWSRYLTGEQGKAVDYDPLKIMVEQAHLRSIAIHAWLNPYRISLTGSVCDSHPAKKWIDENSDNVIITDSGTFFNPASAPATKLILDGVREIAENYDVDGIHIDDYFYMSQSEEIDKNDYEKYTSAGGRLSLDEWRRQNINTFVSSMYNTVKAVNENLTVSVSPAGNVDNNYNTLYADVKKWASEKGYCDWLIPQIYYGFESEKLPFEKAADEWKKLKKEKSVKLIAGLGAYRVLEENEGEWVSEDIILRQIKYAEGAGYEGYSLFSYSSLFSEKFSENLESMKSLSDSETQN